MNSPRLPYATNGTCNMAPGVASGNWNWSWSSKGYGATTYADWKAYERLPIDITRVATTAGGNREL